MLEAIEQQLAADGRLTCSFGTGRVYLDLRGAGATDWEMEAQLARALEMAAAARSLLAADTRAAVRVHARHAIVVRYEDATVAAGCNVRAEWECVVPTSAD